MNQHEAKEQVKQMLRDGREKALWFHLWWGTGLSMKKAREIIQELWEEIACEQEKTNDV